jgi:hypothetical protein
MKVNEEDITGACVVSPTKNFMPGTDKGRGKI